MKELAVSKLKATCVAVVEEVRRTRSPIRITRFGKPVADIVPVATRGNKDWVGSMRDTVESMGDLVAPVRAFAGWEDGMPEAKHEGKQEAEAR